MIQLAGVPQTRVARIRRRTRSRLGAVISRRAALALLALMLIVLAECVGFVSLHPEGSAFAFWACGACHA